MRGVGGEGVGGVGGEGVDLLKIKLRNQWRREEEED